MKKRSFIAALAMLVVSAIVLTSATFAWFTMGDSVSVDTLQAGVAEASGLQISADGTTWKSTINSSDILGAATANGSIVPSQTINDRAVSPVSSVGNATFCSGVLQDGQLKITANATSGYYKFPIWIKYAGSGSTYVTLDNTDSTVSVVNAVRNGYTAGGTNAANNADKAVRVAISTESSGSIQTGKIWAPNTTDSTLYYVANTTANFNTEASAKTALNDNAWTDSASGISLTLTGNSQADKFWVTIWLEGTDSNCTDTTAAGGDFQVALKFNKASA